MRKIVIFDVDGTLSDATHRRHYVVEPYPPVLGWKKDFKKFIELQTLDPPFIFTVTLAQKLAVDHDVHIVTGRHANHRKDTETWLRHQGVPYCALHMPRMGNRAFDRDDNLKREWLHSFKDRDKVIAVFEDRDRVVKMWREEGIQCFQVAEGDF